MGEVVVVDVQPLEQGTCVVAAEGFGQDGSTAPGAYIFTLTGGDTL